MRFQASTAGLWLALGSLATAVLSPGVVALPVDDEPETPCDNLLDVLGDMGQLVGTLQGAIILGVPRASTPARAATTQLLSVVNSAVDVVQGAYESTDACQTNPDTAREGLSCTALDNSAKIVAQVVDLMAKLAASSGTAGLDVVSIQAVVDDAKTKFQLAEPELKKTEGCPAT